MNGSIIHEDKSYEHVELLNDRCKLLKIIYTMTPLQGVLRQ